MKIAGIAILAAVTLAPQMPVIVGAFECPKHFKEAQAAIDKVAGDMKGMAKTMSKRDMVPVHALLDVAEMKLAGAKHNHEKP